MKLAEFQLVRLSAKIAIYKCSLMGDGWVLGNIYRVFHCFSVMVIPGV